MPQDKISTTNVRIAVAKLELTPLMPILARIEVIAAKIAERNANNTHMEKSPLKFIYSLNDNDWINEEEYNSGQVRKVTVNCIDGGGSGCLRDTFTKT